MIPSALRGASVLLVAAALLAPGSARAACPIDSVGFGGHGTLPLDQAVFDSTSTEFGSFHAGFDLQSGFWLYVDQCCNLAETFVEASDDFDIAGLPPGTIVPVTVEVMCDGTVQVPGGVLSCTVHLDGQTSAYTSPTPPYPPGPLAVGQTSYLPTTMVVGQPKRIEVRLAGRRTVGSPVNSAASGGRASLGIYGLPAGAWVTSCRAPRTSPTPAHTSTWGQLKAIYR